MTRDEQREAAIDDYRLRFGEVKGHELDAVVFGFNRGYQAGSEGRLADEHRKVSEAYQHGYDDGEKEGYERAKQED